MILYKLAKQLKEARFFQEIGFEMEGSFYIKENPTFSDEIFFVEYKNKETFALYDAVKIPTLSELIEACGDKFSHLIRIDEDKWIVSDNESIIYGTTPEEVLVELWLALNKK